MSESHQLYLQKALSQMFKKPFPADHLKIYRITVVWICSYHVGKQTRQKSSILKFLTLLRNYNQYSSTSCTNNGLTGKIVKMVFTWDVVFLKVTFPKQLFEI